MCVCIRARNRETWGFALADARVNRQNRDGGKIGAGSARAGACLREVPMLNKSAWNRFRKQVAGAVAVVGIALAPGMAAAESEAATAEQDQDKTKHEQPQGDPPDQATIVLSDKQLAIQEDEGIGGR